MTLRSLEICIQIICYNLLKQNQKLGSDSALQQSTTVSSIKCPELSVQGPAFRVQRPESSVHSPTSRIQRPEPSVQSPTSNTWVQSPGISVYQHQHLLICTYMCLLLRYYGAHNVNQTDAAH